MIILGIVSVVILAYLVVTTGLIVWFCKNYFPKSTEITMEEAKKLIEDVQFWNMVQEYAEGKNCTSSAPVCENGYVTVLVPCAYNGCSCSEAREDCCSTGVDIDDKRYCKTIIDINKLCGLPSIGERPDPSKILTDEECKMIAESLANFLEEKNEKK